MILFWKDGRGLHDILAGTKVIDVREENNLEVVEEQKSTQEEVEVIKPKKTKNKKNNER